MEELADENFILFNEDFYLNDKIIENAKNAGFIAEHGLTNLTMECD